MSNNERPTGLALLSCSGMSFPFVLSQKGCVIIRDLCSLRNVVRERGYEYVPSNCDADRKKIRTIYERMKEGGQSEKLYYFDEPSSTMEILNLIKDQSFFATFDQFAADCKSGDLPEYCLIEPN
jgi:hypothetical protein